MREPSIGRSSCRTCRFSYEGVEDYEQELCRHCYFSGFPKTIPPGPIEWLPRPFWTPAERAGLKAMGAEIQPTFTMFRTTGIRVAICAFVKAAIAVKEK